MESASAASGSAIGEANPKFASAREAIMAVIENFILDFWAVVELAKEKSVLWAVSVKVG